MNHSGWNMYVFRNGRQAVSGPVLVQSLTSALDRWQRAPEHDSEDAVLAALVAAGELECALLDDADDTGDSCQIAARITDSVAHALLAGKIDSYISIYESVKQLHVGAHYEAAVQEGFAYYALHPRKMAMLLDGLALGRRVRVLGIRSIGVTLSAVACAALRRRGVECERTTVRPTGHPYNRTLEVSCGLRKWIASAADAEFLIVDEGPGISGSSFLSVAESLAGCGVPSGRIHMIGSRMVDPATLRAENAATRWARFRFHVLQVEPIAPPEAGESLSGGTWRRYFHCDENAIPASWAQLEPAKFLARDEHSLFRFEGFGHYGEAVGARTKMLSECGFAPRYLGNRRGFGEYELAAGRSLRISDLSSELLRRMAEYLALRSASFGSTCLQTPELEKMLRWNWKLEFDDELSTAESQLCAERVVICDGRMMPHKWLRTAAGELLKLDSGGHGDNHFFPGPCDIAWDVAGTIVEWNLRGEMRERFLSEYESQSGDSVRQRLAPYLLAYTVFCLGWSRMAAAAMQGEYDEALLIRDAAQYRTRALQLRYEPQKASASEQSAMA